MLIEFRVRNHRSIRQEQCLTMEAGPRQDPLDPRVRRVLGAKKPLLCAAGIYGANASGKTNVLRALAWMGEAVKRSHSFWSPRGGVPREAFAWGAGAQEDSLFEAMFVVGAVRYQYGFVVDDEKVVEEWLYDWPNQRKRVLFEREGDQYHFSSHLGGAHKLIRDMTRKNSLFLSVAALNNEPRLRPVALFFYFVFEVWGMGSEDFKSRNFFEWHSMPEFHAGNLVQNQKERVVELLKIGDPSVVDVKMLNEDHVGLEEIKLCHHHGGVQVWLDLKKESQGTQHLFGLMPKLLAALETGSLYLMDEIESSFHPWLVARWIHLFNDPSINTKHAQLLFSTHDTTLLSAHSLEEPLRQDQVWLTEKNEQGETQLYPLTDYKIKKGEDLEWAYLYGRYGGVPRLPPLVGGL
jgi:predicted ATPase